MRWIFRAATLALAVFVPSGCGVATAPLHEGLPNRAGNPASRLSPPSESLPPEARDPAPGEAVIPASKPDQNAAAVSAADPDFFRKKVEPVLVANCYECHGPTEQEGGLRLDSRAAMLKGGVDGPALLPGNPKDSLIGMAITYENFITMPPTGRMEQSAIEAILEWIENGAEWPEGPPGPKSTPAVLPAGAGGPHHHGHSSLEGHAPRALSGGGAS